MIKKKRMLTQRRRRGKKLLVIHLFVKFKDLIYLLKVLSETKNAR